MRKSEPALREMQWYLKLTSVEEWVGGALGYVQIVPGMRLILNLQ